MADTQSTTATEPVADAPEPEAPAEVEEETSDDDVDLEDIEVTPEDLGDEPEDKTEEESDTESEQEAEETEAEDEAEEDTEPELSDEEKLKQHNREMAEKRIQEKQQREATIKQQQDEYITEGEDPRDMALRQLQVDAYNTKVEGNANKLANGYQQAIKDFEVLADESPAIKAEVDAALDAFQAQYLTLDSYGNPTEVRGDLYAFLQTKADSIKQLTGIGAREQVKSKAKEKSKVIATPSRSPKEPKVDPDLAAFEEEAGRW